MGRRRKIRCTYCDAVLSIDSAWRGGSVICGRCGVSFFVPERKSLFGKTERVFSARRLASDAGDAHGREHHVAEAAPPSGRKLSVTLLGASVLAGAFAGLYLVERFGGRRTSAPPVVRVQVVDDAPKIRPVARQSLTPENDFQKKLLEEKTRYALSARPERRNAPDMDAILAQKSKPAQIRDFSANAGVVDRYAKFELTFRLPREYKNPFDPSEIDIVAYFVAPDGTTVAVNGFRYQDYARGIYDGVEKIYPPRGRPCWKVRFAPQTAGQYRYIVTYTDSNGFHVGEWREFSARPSAARGFVGISAVDRRYFEFANGEMCYLIGPTVRSPGDHRKAYDYKFEIPHDEGTYFYERYFRLLSENGANFANVWMSPWWLGLEWRKGFQPFRGIGDYSMENAWRMDKLCEIAERYGIYMALVLINHGQYGLRHAADRQFEDSPYFIANGGWLDDPQKMFTDERARALTRMRHRYVVARWAYSPSILMWALISETELTEAFHRDKQPENVLLWCREMTDHLRALDPTPRPATTGFSNPRSAPQFWKSDAMEVVFTNAYGSLIGEAYFRPDLCPLRYFEMTNHGKANLVMESGPSHTRVPDQFVGGNNDERRIDLLRTSLHAGSWATYLTNLSGVTGWWWWNWLEASDAFGVYAALRTFDDGWDRRGRGLLTERPWTSDEDILSIVLRNERVARGWIYHKRAVFSSALEIRIESGLTLTIREMLKGRYRVRFYDTLTGLQAGGIQKIENADGTLKITAPVFTRDIAFKAERISK